MQAGSTSTLHLLLADDRGRKERTSSKTKGMVGRSISKRARRTQRSRISKKGHDRFPAPCPARSLEHHLLSSASLASLDLNGKRGCSVAISAPGLLLHRCDMLPCTAVGSWHLFCVAWCLWASWMHYSSGGTSESGCTFGTLCTLSFAYVSVAVCHWPAPAKQVRR